MNREKQARWRKRFFDDGGKAITLWLPAALSEKLEAGAKKAGMSRHAYVLHLLQNNG